MALRYEELLAVNRPVSLVGGMFYCLVHIGILLICSEYITGCNEKHHYSRDDEEYVFDLYLPL